MLDKIIELLKKMGVLADDKVDEVKNSLGEIVKDEPGPPTPPPTSPPTLPTNVSPELKAFFENMSNQINALTAQNKSLMASLDKERSDRESMIKIQNDQAKAEKERKISDAVDDAIKKGYYPESKRETIKKIATNDLEAFQEMLKDMKPDPRFIKPEKKTPETEHVIKTPLDTGNAGILAKVKEFAGNGAE